ncbi:MAG: hypothetical protein ABIH38_01410 [Patescibacteria group bacterium]
MSPTQIGALCSLFGSALCLVVSVVLWQLVLPFAGRQLFEEETGEVRPKITTYPTEKKAVRRFIGCLLISAAILIVLSIYLFYRK